MAGLLTASYLDQLDNVPPMRWMVKQTGKNPIKNPTMLNQLPDEDSHVIQPLIAA